MVTAKRKKKQPWAVPKRKVSVVCVPIPGYERSQAVTGEKRVTAQCSPGRRLLLYKHKTVPAAQSHVLCDADSIATLKEKRIPIKGKKEKKGSNKE